MLTIERVKLHLKFESVFFFPSHSSAVDTLPAMTKSAPKNDTFNSFTVPKHCDIR